MIAPKIFATGSHIYTLTYLASHCFRVCWKPSKTLSPKHKGPSIASTMSLNVRIVSIHKAAASKSTFKNSAIQFLIIFFNPKPLTWAAIGLVLAPEAVELSGWLYWYHLSGSVFVPDTPWFWAANCCGVGESIVWIAWFEVVTIAAVAVTVGDNTPLIIASTAVKLIMQKPITNGLSKG